jgi:hypothetical protein
VPSRVHIFLWLMANNKTLTRDNLAKRKNVEDMTCLFCKENEFVHHLFFNCCVAKVMWNEFSDMLGIEIKPDFESVEKMWILRKKFKLVNVCTFAVLWSIWKFRNDMIFQCGGGQVQESCCKVVQG